MSAHNSQHLQCWVQVGAVTYIDFSPLYPYNYAVTSSTRVIIFDAHTRRPLTTLSRFKDKAYSGTFRSDGRLLVAGGETGFVQVRRLSIKTQLRQEVPDTSADVSFAFGRRCTSGAPAGHRSKTHRCWLPCLMLPWVSLTAHAGCALLLVSNKHSVWTA